ncbi:hypothetical protein [Terrimonas sp.]|uniref:hypothetical protein n=1 Tax=Terrimonas sp. TaxID=1914338 RepID=UPI0010571C51|nr:hypothetical protein [Terrimonas sp.]
MRALITFFFAGVFFCTLTQCKKGKNTPQPVDNDEKNVVENGRYIIRSKYFCNGGCFVFRFGQNYETINWEWTTKENLESIKQDADPFNYYVWNIAKTGAIGSGIYIYADPLSPDGVSEKLTNPLSYYAIYQQMPDGNYSYLPQDALPYGYTDDPAETGGPSAYVSMINTDISPVSNEFNHDLARVFIRKITDSTRRITLMRNGMWATYFSLLVDPDGSACDDLDNTNYSHPVWRGTWLCPHTASIGNAWHVDACYTSQVVLEKID